MRRRFFKGASKKAGLPPGSLVHIGDEPPTSSTVDVIDFDTDDMERVRLDDPADAAAYRDNGNVTWVNVNGVQDGEVIGAIGEAFDIHPLNQEDIMNTEQRPKIDDTDGYVFFLMKMLYVDEEDRIVTEQITIILGEDYVLSFQEVEGDIFDSIRGRLDSGKGRIRGAGPDYLAYALMDTIVDHYYLVLEHVGGQVDVLETELVADPDPDTLRSLHGLKRDLVDIRRSVWPLREVLSTLQRIDTPLIKDSTDIYLRDVYDHTVQVIDTIETFRDIISSMTDVYLSSVSNRMNEVMKVLTVIGSIFIPLTFITGLYGMNFQYMPELSHPAAYPAVWAIMLLIAVGQLIYFKRREWI